MKPIKLVRQLFFIFLVSTFFSACKQQEDVYEKYRKSVVLLVHEFVHKVDINGEAIYFTYEPASRSIPKIYASREEAAKNTSVGYGTGFFVDEEGRIITNKHVVDDWYEAYESDCKNILRKLMDEQKRKWAYKKDSATEQRAVWYSKSINDYYEYDRQRARGQVEAWKRLETDYYREQSFWETMISALPEAKFGVESVFLGYATDGTFAQKLSDYKACQKIKVSKDEQIDLALLQANDRRLPEEVSEVIDVANFADNPRVGDDVSIIGYNYGPLIAASQNAGLRCQKTDGRISQENDGIRVMYSIPTLQGSSGSPVFNQRGQLIAVNYAGISTTQSFNYGILAKHIPELLK